MVELESFYHSNELHFTARLLHFAETETLDFMGFYRISDVVGYNTVEAPAAGSYKALSVAFDNVGENVTFPIAELLTVANPKGGAAFGVAADQIWLWDTLANDWVKYYYRAFGTTVTGWCKAGTTVATTDTIGIGETFFFRRGGGGAATTITLSGQVKEFTASAQYAAPAAGSYKFIGYPWPTELPIAGFEKFQGAPKGGAAFGVAADQIWLWDTLANDWVKYYYRAFGTTVTGWCKAGTTVVTTDTIPAGQGFFFRRAGGGSADTITFTYSAAE